LVGFALNRSMLFRAGLTRLDFERLGFRAFFSVFCPRNDCGFSGGRNGLGCYNAGFVPILKLAYEPRTIFPSITVHHRGIPNGVCANCGWITAWAKSS
jgi:hypothetical protein